MNNPNQPRLLKLTRDYIDAVDAFDKSATYDKKAKRDNIQKMLLNELENWPADEVRKVETLL